MVSLAELVRWFQRTRGPLRPDERGDVGKQVRHRAVARVRRELTQLGIDTPLRFVWSDDGSGVEEDAPGVIHLMRSLVRADSVPARVLEAADRVMALDIGGVARHEVGHALLFARPRDARGARFRRLFGDVDTLYRVGNPATEVVRRLVDHGGLANPRYRRLVSLYAATHPHERFAEAVRIVLERGPDDAALRAWVERTGTAPIVLDQLLWTRDWLGGYSSARVRPAARRARRRRARR